MDLFTAVLQGAPPGAVYALIALGFVLTYKTSGVFNLAFGAQAYMSAALYFKLRVEWGWHIVPSLVIAIVVFAPLVGLLIEQLIFRHLRTAPAVAKLVVAIGLSVALPNLFDLIAGFEAVAGRAPRGIISDGDTVFYDPFGVYAFSRDELAQLVLAGVSAAGLGALFRFSSLGLSMRAVVESPRMAELMGINADRVAASSWALSSLFAGLAGVLIAPRFNTLVAPDFFNLLVVAIAAAAIGRLVSLPRALGGGLFLGVMIAILNTYLPRWSDDIQWLKVVQDNLAPAVPFVVLFAVLVFSPAIRRTGDSVDPMADVEPPPAPLEAVSLTGPLRTYSRVVGAGLLGVLGLVVFLRADDFWIFLVTQAVVLAIVYLSITVMTGLAGQVSLCQGVFAAVGGFTVFQMADRWDTSVLVAALVGSVVAAVVGAVVSIPVLRLGGVWLAAATLAFALFFDSVIVKLSWVGGGDTSLLQGTRVERPELGPIDFSSDLSFLVLAVVALLCVSVVVVRVREGTVGWTLRAIRGSEVAAASIGISPSRARMTAFALSASIAGLGGGLLAIHQENVNYASNFGPTAALFWLILVVSLSARTVEGAVQAGVAFSLVDAVILRGTFLGWILRGSDRIPGIFPISPKWRFILFGIMSMQYARHPEGVLEHGKRRIGARIERRFTSGAENSIKSAAAAIPHMGLSEDPEDHT